MIKLITILFLLCAVNSQAQFIKKDGTVRYVSSEGDTTSFGYIINVQALTSSPADAATIYFGMLPKAPTTTASNSLGTFNIVSYSVGQSDYSIRPTYNGNANAYISCVVAYNADKTSDRGGINSIINGYYAVY